MAWFIAWLLYTILVMVTRRQLLSPLRGVANAHWIWQATFLAAIAWLLVWALVLSLTPQAAS
jgi:hypothetical protein